MDVGSVVGHQHKTGDVASNSEDHSRWERKNKYTVHWKVKYKNDNEQCNRLEIGKNTFKKKELRKEKLGKNRLMSPESCHDMDWGKMTDNFWH